jgi:hypothetical protein
MTDLKSPRLIVCKGFLFLLLGLLAGGWLLVRNADLETALLLGITVWAFCRFYYFMFYVIEHYIDPRYRFAGLTSFARYLWRSRRDHDQPRQDGSQNLIEK